MQDTQEAPSARFRKTVGHFATGVVVLTSMEDQTPVGMTVQSFTSVSLDPLLVGLVVSRNSSSWARIEATGQVCINILASDQAHVSQRFAQPVTDRFEGVAWHRSAHGLPVLGNVMAWLDCDIQSTHPAGDHDMVLCAVRDLAVTRTTEPLLFYRGTYSTITSWRSVGQDAVDGLPAPW